MARLLLLDTETGGLDPLTHSLLSIGLGVWEDGKLGEQTEIFVAEPEIVTVPEAMSCNGIDLETFQGLAPREAVAKVNAFVAANFPEGKATVAGHNVHFDVSFVKRLYRLAGANKGPPFSHRLVDTAAIVHFLRLAGRLDVGDGSDAAFEHFRIEIPTGKRHTALADAVATGQLLIRLIELIRA